MIARVETTALLGIDAFTVDLEVDLARSGMPAFCMVGLAEGAVRESKERVFSALKNSGFKLPPSRITVNLAPADVRKEGSGYDLPLALGLLAGAGEIPEHALRGYYMAGELSLSGELRPVTGILPMAIKARDMQAKALFVPRQNAAEAAVVKGLTVLPLDSLSQSIRFFLGETTIEPASSDLDSLWALREEHHVDFSEVKGQEHAKRAIEIAAAGAHNLLFLGPPGSGKTMLAKRIPTVLPPLGFDEALEVTKIYSVAGHLKSDPMIVSRPFRSPHHTISDAGLIGGGQYPKPGEVSLAHRGVLFLDELPEFKKHVLEVLRQPLEDGHVTISRAAVSLSYPADFMLVAAMNPCPCGYLGDERHPCICTPSQIQRYRSRLSGPLLDRIDLQVEVPAVPYKELRQNTGSLDSATMRTRIGAARAIQAHRYQDTPLLTNAQLSGKWLQQFCPLGDTEHAFLESAVKRLGLSARAFTRILRIARTIADLSGDHAINIHHLAEAINYRSLDRQNESF
ncbi:YifB family Mg chelatase-like AAA ATPase [Desulfoplanes formicivorans]|uniref:Magnesium chelatase n=1 Tax=Desulfoplanes formicivorans TaxID=1592317 RepID=A0A194ACV2_9BACT|nr:YifB family Mg chelatase-like AAA ATPase [Desulfoplanes formicivorans]GAU07937.1 magnesium chelatase [Desulfoplanes formicivorans]